MGIIFRESAFRHGYTEVQIREVLAGGERFEIEADDFDNAQVCVVGFTEMEVLLEVRVTYLDDDIDSVYHCQRANNYWRNRFEEQFKDNLK